jgi:hypothetical protein
MDLGSGTNQTMDARVLERCAADASYRPLNPGFPALPAA